MVFHIFILYVVLCCKLSWLPVQFGSIVFFFRCCKFHIASAVVWDGCQHINCM